MVKVDYFKKKRKEINAFYLFIPLNVYTIWLLFVVDLWVPFIC